MSTFDIVFTVLAFAGPMAVFAGYLTVIIGYGNGLGAPMTYLLVGLGVLLFALGFTAMSKYLPNPGGFYAYVTAGLGRPIGLAGAFLAMLAYTLLAIQAYLYLGNSVNRLVTDLFNGPNVPSWLVFAVLVPTIAVLGHLRISFSARVLSVVLCVEIVIMVVFDAVVIGRGGSAGLSSEPLHPESVFSGSVGLALLFCVGTFIGFEATAAFREEARDPERSIPRATFITVGVITGLYSITSYALINAIGPAQAVEATAADPIGAAMGAVHDFLGVTGGRIVLVMISTGMFAGLIAAHNIATRYLFSLGRDGVLPRRLGTAHHAHGSPSIASFTVVTSCGALLFVLALLDNHDPAFYAKFGGVGTYVLVALLVLTSAAIPVYFASRIREGHRHNIWAAIVAPTLAGLGFAIILVLATSNADFLVGADPATSMILVLIGVLVPATVGVFYALYLRKNRPHIYDTIGRQDL